MCGNIAERRSLQHSLVFSLRNSDTKGAGRVRNTYRFGIPSICFCEIGSATTTGCLVAVSLYSTRLDRLNSFISMLEVRLARNRARQVCC